MASEEELWRKRLLEEEVTPPASVWQGIEAALDQPKRRGAFFWVFRIGGIAAALVLVGLGVWFQRSSFSTGIRPLTQKTKSITPPISRKTSKLDPILPRVNQPVLTNVSTKVQHRDEQPLPVELLASVEVLDEMSRTNLEIAPLPSLEFAWYGNRFQWNRPRLVVPDFEEITAPSSERSRDSYLAFHSSVAPFQPGVQWPGLEQQAFAAVQETLQDEIPFLTTSGNRVLSPFENVDDIGIASVYDPSTLRPEQDFATGWAVQWAANMGWFITKRWGIEVGVRYVQGATTSESNVFGWNAANSEFQSFFESSIIQPDSRGAAVIASKETMQSRYHWVSFPVQAVYRVPLSEFWDLAVTGGIALDKLVVNQWAWDGQVTEQGYRPAGSSYRPVSASALAGVRVGRKFGAHWQATGGVFSQHAISSWLSNEKARMHPQQWGGQLGLAYHFR